jgi:branched-subunit amino acid transport protein AzlD
MLVIYCLRNTSIQAAPHGLPELIAAAVVIGLQAWKRNALASILTGTAAYMMMVQLVF